MRAGFFLQEIGTAEILKYIDEALEVSFELSSSTTGSDVVIEAVCDSRLGGDACLAFAPGLNRKPVDVVGRGLVIVDEFHADDASSNIYCRVRDARAVFIDLLNHLRFTIGIEPHRENYQAEATIDETASIASGAVVENGVSVGRHVTIGAGAVVKAGTKIGEGSVIGENACIGNNGITLYKAEDGRLLKFPHIAGVSIGSGAEIGAGSVIPGGILSSTEIGDNVVIGNLCNIGHGARIDDMVWMSVGVLVGGHTSIGNAVTIGMGAMVRDNRDIGSGASIGMGSVVVKNVPENSSMFGNPARKMSKLSTGPKR